MTTTYPSGRSMTEAVRAGGWRIVVPDGAAADELDLERTWHDGVCTSRLVNRGTADVAVREVHLASVPHTLAAETPLYGEGFQKLSQYRGTIAERTNIGVFEDRKHYRRPEAEGAQTLYDLVALGAPESATDLLAFVTCDRFNGQFRVYPDRLDVVLECEDLVLAGGASWALEELLVLTAPDRQAALEALGSAMAVPEIREHVVPTGWCSWYWFWENVTADDVLRNAEAIQQAGLDLRYVQIDDGYQQALGDWLTPKAGDPGIGEVCDRIRNAGLEPAIWLAPFIAEADSVVLRDHPEWFVSDGNGSPVASDTETYGGWRNGPWYVIDATHPGARAYLTDVFTTMRRDFGIGYFKLDALMWGSMWWGHRFDPTVSSVEAYRSLLRLIREAVGPDSVVLGCNAALWPSLGLVDVMRTTGDIWRSWRAIRTCADEGLSREWQHRRLWINDPDCLVLSNQGDSTLGDAEFSFLSAYIVATGGSVFSGDDVSGYDARQVETLRRALLPATGTSAVDPSFEFVATEKDGRTVGCLLNRSDGTRRYRLSGPAARDFWSDEPVGEGEVIEVELAARSGSVLTAAEPGGASFRLLQAEDV